ncbi:MAG: hypothetical protein H2174_07960 [Vampirovibrio sp.]|jgi:hypothetical protein|nr:hypothetical protein [Vampirovibrio sp.]
MMNTHPLDSFESNTVVASTANNRRRKKTLQLILSKSAYTMGVDALPQLTRKQALLKVKRWLRKPTVTPIIERKAKSLMYLFMIEAEELLEAGVSYENVCALQRHWLI